MPKKFNSNHPKNLTIFERITQIFQTREVKPSSIREVIWPISAKTAGNTDKNKQPTKKPTYTNKPAANTFTCPYCQSPDFFKRGKRQNLHESVQLYHCKKCHKTFTQKISKGRHYPLRIVFRALSLYNLGYSLEKVCQLVNKKSATKKREKAFTLSPSTLSRWLNEYADKLPFFRMRDFAIKKYSPQEMTIHQTLAHQQLYHFRFHRAKCELIVQEDYKNRRYDVIGEFLAAVPTDCPHQYFQNKKILRASEAPLAFSKTQMIIRSKHNYANQLCKFVLQSVKDRRQRHEAIQYFMLHNDSVTVATEVPIFLTQDDIKHLQSELGFFIYQRPNNLNSTNQLQLLDPTKLPRLITGHIDILQIRNGQVHILDYKPNASQERPIEQLTIYAMALSRQTGLRLYDFKCAWFDEERYFEFYPLHVLHKPKKGRRRRKIKTKEGIYNINQKQTKVTALKPSSTNPREVIH